MRYLLDVKGNKPGSVEDVMYRLGVLFTETRRGWWFAILQLSRKTTTVASPLRCRTCRTPLCCASRRAVGLSQSGGVMPEKRVECGSRWRPWLCALAVSIAVAACRQAPS